MPALLSKHAELWEGIRKNYCEKISKLEEKETTLRYRLEAIERLIEIQEQAQLTQNFKKPNRRVSYDDAFSSDPCGYTDNVGAKDKSDSSPSTVPKVRSCVCSPCPYKQKYSGQDCECICTRDEEPSDKESSSNCTDQKLAELLRKIEETAPEILARDVNVPPPTDDIIKGNKGSTNGCGEDIEAMVKNKIMPIIDDMLEDFCNCCEDVQQVFDPIQSKHNCSCLEMLNIPTKEDGSMCVCPKCSCSPCDLHAKQQNEPTKLPSFSKPPAQAPSSQQHAAPKSRAQPKCVCDDRKSTTGSRISGCECGICECEKCPQIKSSLHLVPCECPECICEPCMPGGYPTGCECIQCECEKCALQEFERKNKKTKDKKIGCECDPCDFEPVRDVSSRVKDCACDPCDFDTPPVKNFKKDSGCGCDSSEAKMKSPSKLSRPSKIPVYKTGGCGNKCGCKIPCRCDPCYYDPVTTEKLERLKCSCSPQPSATKPDQVNKMSSSITNAKPKQRSKSPKKRTSNASSSMSLKSVDIGHMKEIIDMFNKQKKLKESIKQLEKKQKYYSGMTEECKC